MAMAMEFAVMMMTMVNLYSIDCPTGSNACQYYQAGKQFENRWYTFAYLGYFAEVGGQDLTYRLCGTKLAEKCVTQDNGGASVTICNCDTDNCNIDHDCDCSSSTTIGISALALLVSEFVLFEMK